MSLARNWFFTWNNYTDSDVLYVQELECKWIVFQKEVGEKDTPHLQGTIGFHNPKRFSWVKQLFHDNHVEITRDVQRSIKYCTKDEGSVGEPFIKGILPKGKGSRSDLLAVKKMIDDGASEREYIDAHFECAAKHYKFFAHYRLLAQSSRNWITEVHVLYGEPGSGKSRYVSEILPMESTYYQPHGDWWDGYDGQDYVVIDEFETGRHKYRFMKQLCDRYKFSVPVKGGFRNFVAKKIYIISNYGPKEWWPNLEDSHRPEFERRITSQTRFIKLKDKFEKIKEI